MEGRFMLLLNKTVDQSVLKEGFSIPESYQKELFREIGMDIPRGNKLPIKILIGDTEYDAILTNILFDAERYPTHGDLLQIRYKANGPLSQALQAIFSHTAQRVKSLRQQGLSARVSSWDNDQKEYLAVYSTPVQNHIAFECITNSELLEEASELRKYDELITEEILEAKDVSAAIQIKTKACKVRKMNRAIGEELKRLYNYSCQICGCRIGERYGSNLIHAHHIEYFTKSMNNDASNILIVCPNHHGIIHDRNPLFDLKTKTYHYPNGYVEGLALNRHIQ